MISSPWQAWNLKILYFFTKSILCLFVFRVTFFVTRFLSKSMHSLFMARRILREWERERERELDIDIFLCRLGLYMEFSLKMHEFIKASIFRKNTFKLHQACPWTNAAKKTHCIWKFFHPWILRRARSTPAALVGFIFISRQAGGRASTGQQPGLVQCGATVIIDEIKLYQVHLNKSLTFSNELFLVQFLQNICSGIGALSQVSSRIIFTWSCVADTL